jgi:hypothetical protein
MTEYYRSTPTALDHSQHDLGWLDYFRTHSPAEWTGSPKAREEFAKIFGEAELKIAVDDNLVPENIDPVWVGGTKWSDPFLRRRAVYGSLQPVIVSTELPKPGMTSEDAQILSKLSNIESLCYRILSK